MSQPMNGYRQSLKCSEIPLGILYLCQRASVLCLLVLLAACQSRMVDLAQLKPINTPTTSPAERVTTSQAQPEAASPTISSPTPQSILLTVPDRWANAASEAIDQITDSSHAGWWQLNISSDPSQEFEHGRANIALVEGNHGIFAGQRPLALVVPFTSELEAITMAEVQQILSEVTPFVAVMDWADIPVTHKALRVDGFHPSHPNYPLQQIWSLIAAPGYEMAAAELASVLDTSIRQDTVVHIVAVGDVMLDRALGEIIRSGNIAYPFAAVAELLTAADLTVGNLESALGSQGTPANKGYRFRAPPEAVHALSQAGFDLVSLANNHALDYGPQALQQGIDALHQQGIATVGAGADETTAHEPYIFKVDDITLAFLAYVNVPVEVGGFDTRTWSATANRPGMAWADEANILADVTSARQLADLVIVLLHSGFESVTEPNTPQITSAHAAIDAGADLVIGHHAHVLQGIEFYNDGVIAYSMGNFAFAGYGQSDSSMLNVWLDADGVRQVEFIPVILESDGHPRPATEAEAAAIRQQVYNLTKALNR